MRKIFTLILALVATISLTMAQSPLTADGAINALFSTSDTTQVLFSRGNLQYNAAQGTHACADGTTQAGTWHFATEQYDVRLSENANRSASYDGWIDLFTYGASGYNGQMPYNNSSELTKEKMSELGKIAGTYYDFGTYNAIENGGNTPGLWHMFTLREWNYLVNTRANASSLRGHAKINNIHGIILLPDNCDLTALHQIASFATGDNAMNNYSLSVWQQIEVLGAVFLPSGGRYETSIINANDGNYMASFSPYMNAIDGVYFTDNTISTATFPQAALSVRLVKDAPKIYYLHATPNNEAWGAISGDTIYFGEDITITATPNDGYHFVQWSDGLTDNPRTFTLTGDSTIIAEFEINRYRVQFIDWNGEILKTDSVDWSSAATAPGNPAREGYTFVGWGSDFSSVKADLYVIAQYERELTGITVSYMDEDNAEIESEIINFTLPLKPLHPGRKFVTWQVLPASDINDGITIRATYEEDEITVQPATTTATFFWSFVTGGFTYTLSIYTDASLTTLFCTITFNQSGVLIGINYANRAPRRMVQQEEGFTYTVSDLDANTVYYYKMVTRDEDEVAIGLDEGAFQTKASDTPTDTQSPISNHQSPTKIVQDNHVYILRGNQIHSVTGQQVK